MNLSTNIKTPPSSSSDLISKATGTASGTNVNPKVKEDDEILCCGGCGCYGMSGEFLNSDACSAACQVQLF